MEKVIKQYKLIVSNAWEISQTLLDMEGGRYVLAMFSELIQKLLDDGNISGATLAIRKLYDAAEVHFDQLDLNQDNSVAWVTFFTETIGDAFEKSITEPQPR